MRYFCHMTDGTDLILDGRGRSARSRREIDSLARSAAAQVMAAVKGPVDWTGWLVSVQDRNGSMVKVVPFPQRAS